MQLVAVAHAPVGQVLYKLIAEAHLLPERQVVPSLHHRLHQLAEPRLDVERMDGGVKVSNISDDGEHHQFNARLTKVLCCLLLTSLCALTLLPAAGFQNILHDEDDVLDELSVGFIHHNLATLVKELLHNDLYLVE